MKKEINDYVFYKLICDDCPDNIYIGSTCNLRARKRCHKTKCHNPNDKSYNVKKYVTIRQYGGWDNWQMIVIDEVKQLTLRQSEAHEEELRVKYEGNLNSQRCFISTEELKEKRADYFDEYNKKESTKERKHDWYIDNKEKSMEACKKRREERCECEICGVWYTKCRYSEHIKQSNHKWSVEHNTKFVKNKDKTFACECGVTLLIKSKSSHLKTKCHQAYVNK